MFKQILVYVSHMVQPILGATLPTPFLFHSFRRLWPEVPPEPDTPFPATCWRPVNFGDGCDGASDSMFVGL